MTAVRTGILEALRDEYEAGTRLVLGRPCWSELGTDDLRGAKVDPVVLGIWLEASHSGIPSRRRC